MKPSVVNNQTSSPSWSCLRFSFDEIKRATNEFADENYLEEGPFGKVYLGNISGDSYSGKVTVECLNLERFQGDVLESQKEILTTHHHANIISLVGFCDEEDDKILVYEFMPNGSLNDYLYKRQDHISRLTVKQRLEICLGAAKAFSHLHSGADFHIIHSNLKTDHILLDASLVPKISGFGFSKVHAAGPSCLQIDTNTGGGTYGCIAPECCEPNYKPSRKVNVYAFGIVLLEVLCERQPSHGLLLLSLPFVMRGELPKFTPEHVEKNISAECARRCEKIISDCFEFQPDKRPNMNQVVSELELALKLQKRYQDVKEQNKFQANSKHLMFETSSMNKRCKSFSLLGIKEATNDFSNLIGEGGFGHVYYGRISIKSKIVELAVKRMNENIKNGLPAFEMERKLLSDCRHVNIISLVGYCDEEDEKILVYRFMSNGSLYNQIYEHHDPTPRMTIEQRLEILLGVAKGLNYLHSRQDYNIIHSDLKTDNILLDANFVPKISDFGLSRTRDVGPSGSAQATQNIQGTPGYIAPECYETNYKMSRKADVYAFGVVMLEVLCEKRAWENLIFLAQPFFFKRELPRFAPKHLRKNISPQCSRACMILIRDCLDNDPNNRPSMSHVIAALENALRLQVMNLGQRRQSRQAISQQIFSISDIETITNRFSQRNIITRNGCFWDFNHDNRFVVFVERIKIESKEAVHFIQNEIDLLSACHHPNVISLLGHCDKPNEKILIFEFMPNVSLSNLLHSELHSDIYLTVEQRLEICLGVAKGLCYLHFGLEISHGDLKTCNILLDHNFVAKIKGFLFSTKWAAGHWNSHEEPYEIQGSEGYIAPQRYEFDFKVRLKTDVYAFGVVFLKVLCEKKRYFFDLDWQDIPFITLMPEDISPQCARACEDLIRDCLEKDPDQRPFMDQVVDTLESELNAQMQWANYIR